jgi:hypothetical protein
MKARKTMDDQFLQEFRKDPRPELIESLQLKLKQQPLMEERLSRRSWRWLVPTCAAIAATATFVVLLSFPSVRAKAQQFLDLFRVQRFVAVSISPARLEQISQLKDGKIDLKTLLSQSIQVVKEPAKPQPVDSPALAAQMAGIEVRLPAWLPNGVVQGQIRVEDSGAFRFVANTKLLQDVLDGLGITDLLVPQQLNGATVTVSLPRIVLTGYSRGVARATLLQAANPEITLPLGVHLPELVEICLRIAGLSMDEARRFAYSVDWRSTFLVPVPAQVASFREVNVRGAKGLLIEAENRRNPAASRHRGPERGSMLLWSEGDKVYCLSGTIRSVDLLQMANAVQ